MNLKHHKHELDYAIERVLQDPFSSKMNGVIIHDGICGIGKTEYIKEHMKGLLYGSKKLNMLYNKNNRVIYVGQYLDELHRIAGTTRDKDSKYGAPIMDTSNKTSPIYSKDAYGDFKHPIRSWRKNKLLHLEELITNEENIVVTHTLFKTINEKIIDLLKAKSYHLIIDEELTVVEKIEDKYDLKLKDKTESEIYTLTNNEISSLINLNIINIDKENNKVKWNGDRLNRYSDIYKDIENNHIDYYLTQQTKKVKLIWRLNPECFSYFKSIHVLTYLFKGSILNTYFDSFKIPYLIVDLTDKKMLEVYQDELGYVKPIIDPIHELIKVYKPLKFTLPDLKSEHGNSLKKLSKSYFNTLLATKNNPDIEVLKNALASYFKTVNPFSTSIPKKLPTTDEKLWATYKDAYKYLKDDGYINNFLVFNSKATNEYRNRNFLAYFSNPTLPPTINRYFMKYNVQVDTNLWPLSILIQWLFRSAIRDGKGIKLFLPAPELSTRFNIWINKFKEAYEYRMDVVNNEYYTTKDLISNTPNLRYEDYIRHQSGLKHIQNNKVFIKYIDDLISNPSTPPHKPNPQQGK